jgi:membrane-bound metal-dependent hydrolase YbcI (DUF457 family)
MYLEHVVYTAALAVLVGMVYQRITGKDPIWIIVLGSILPDIDALFQYAFFYLNGSFVIVHGDFHTIGGLIVVPCIFALLLTKYNIEFLYGYSCLAIGFAAHIFEDLVVYNGYNYHLLSPFYSKVYRAFGWSINYSPNVLGLFSSICILCVAVAARCWAKGTVWTNPYVEYTMNIYYYTVKSKSVNLVKVAIISFIGDYKFGDKK